MRHLHGNHTGPTLTTHTLVGRVALLFLTLLLNSCGSSSDTPQQPAAPLGNDASLSFLFISDATLEPGFGPSLWDYTASVPNNTSSVAVYATANDRNANLLITPGPANNVPLHVGQNTIKVYVFSADDTTTGIYTIVITRAASDNADLRSLQLTDGSMNPTFEPTTFDYTVTVVFAVTDTQVYAVPEHVNATVTVNEIAVASGVYSQPVVLVEGDTLISIEITAEDGVTTQTYSVTVVRQNMPVAFVETAFMKATDQSVNDFFGSRVELSQDGRTLAVTSAMSVLDFLFDEEVLLRRQPIYVYERNDDASWSAQHPIYLYSNPLSVFDFDVSADGSTIALVTQGDLQLYVFDKEGVGLWIPTELDLQPALYPWVNHVDVALSDDGSTLVMTGGSSAAYIFIRNSDSGWSLQHLIDGSDTPSAQNFSPAVALSGDGATLAIGAASVALVYMFTRDDSDVWIEQTAIAPSNIEAEDWSFGEVVALSSDGSTLVVGDYYADAIYVYDRESDSMWSERRPLKLYSIWPGEAYAPSLALSANGSTMIVGHYVFDRASEDDWSLVSEARPVSGSPRYFGFNVSISADGTTLAVGSPGDDSSASGVNGNDPGPGLPNSGAAYTFERASTSNGLPQVGEIER